MLARNTDVQSVLKLGDAGGRVTFFRRRLFWVVLTVVAVALGVVWWLDSGTSATLTYETTPARRGDITVTVTATGTVQPINQVEVGSELSGAVRSVNVDFNDPVTAGQVLAEIDTDKLTAQANRTRAQLDVASANVAVADATLKETEQNLTRLRALAVRNFASNQDIQAAEAAHDRAIAALDSARAQVKVAEADLASNETDLAKAQIRSPIGGVVLNRNVDPGQTVAASLQAPVLFTIAENLAQMHLLVDVDEADAGSVREGQDATFTVEAFPDKTFTAKVIQLRYAAETVSGVVTYKAVLSADNSSLALRPGMTATANVVVKETKDALLIPNAALRFSPATAAAAQNRSLLQRLMPGAPQPLPQKKEALKGGEKRVYVLKNGAPQEVVVTPGDSDGSFTAVTAGEIAAGDPVITNSSPAQ